RCGGEGERWDQLGRERGSVVVIDRDDHVGLGIRHPFLRFFEARKHPLPIWLLGLLEIDRGADGRHVRRGYACDDSSHVLILPSYPALPPPGEPICCPSSYP